MDQLRKRKSTVFSGGTKSLESYDNKQISMNAARSIKKELNNFLQRQGKDGSIPSGIFIVNEPKRIGNYFQFKLQGVNHLTSTHIDQIKEKLPEFDISFRVVNMASRVDGGSIIQNNEWNLQCDYQNIEKHYLSQKRWRFWLFTFICVIIFIIILVEFVNHTKVSRDPWRPIKLIMGYSD